MRFFCRRLPSGNIKPKGVTVRKLSTEVYYLEVINEELPSECDQAGSAVQILIKFLVKLDGTGRSREEQFDSGAVALIFNAEYFPLEYRIYRHHQGTKAIGAGSDQNLLQMRNENTGIIRMSGIS